jgi:hypothetical protein
MEGKIGVVAAQVETVGNMGATGSTDAGMSPPLGLPKKSAD